MSVQPKEIWIGRGNDQLGPHGLDRIRQLHEQGSLQPGDLLWWDGLAEWTARDAALPLLGIASATPAAVQPPPLPPSMPAAQPAPTRSTAPAARASATPSSPSPERARALMFMFAGLVAFAVLASAGFAFLRSRNLTLPALGQSSREAAELLSAASIYKVAYAEYVMSTDQVPKSLEDLGVASSPYGALASVRIEAGTLLLESRVGTLALQPYRSPNYQIQFRCGFASPPAGMEPLGQTDSAAATSVDRGDLPDDCR